MKSKEKFKLTKVGANLTKCCIVLKTNWKSRSKLILEPLTITGASKFKTNNARKVDWLLLMELVSEIALRIKRLKLKQRWKKWKNPVLISSDNKLCCLHASKQLLKTFRIKPNVTFSTLRIFAWKQLRPNEMKPSKESTAKLKSGQVVLLSETNLSP